MSPNRWARAFLMMGGILLALGILPLLVVGMLFPGADPLLVTFASILLTPLGVVLFSIGLLVWLVAFFRR